jgi:hypothetical protein
MNQMVKSAQQTQLPATTRPLATHTAAEFYNPNQCSGISSSPHWTHANSDLLTPRHYSYPLDALAPGLRKHPTPRFEYQFLYYQWKHITSHINIDGGEYPKGDDVSVGARYTYDIESNIGHYLSVGRYWMLCSSVALYNPTRADASASKQRPAEL